MAQREGVVVVVVAVVVRMTVVAIVMAVVPVTVPKVFAAVTVIPNGPRAGTERCWDLSRPALKGCCKVLPCLGVNRLTEH